jgi:hypothetical protein
MDKRNPILALLIVTTGLSGCGMNALRVQSASNVASLSESVSTEANRILSDAQDRRQDALVTLVASDPSCSPQFPLWIYTPDATFLPPRPGETKPSPPLCAAGKLAGPNYPGYTRVEFNMSPIAQDALRPTVDLIAAVGAYGQALSKVINEPKADITKELGEAIGLAEKAKAQAVALGVSGLPNLPSLTKDQIDTAGALIQMVYDLAREKRQVTAIAELHRKHSAKLGVACPAKQDADSPPCTERDGLLTKLRTQVQNWASIVSTGAAQADVESLNRAYLSERKDLSFEGRRAFVSLVLDAAKEPERIRKASEAFGESVAALSSANANLDRQLFSPNKEDKAAAGVITRQRIVSALSLVLKAVTAWKVI